MVLNWKTPNTIESTFSLLRFTAQWTFFQIYSLKKSSKGKETKILKLYKTKIVTILRQILRMFSLNNILSACSVLTVWNPKFLFLNLRGWLCDMEHQNEEEIKVPLTLKFHLFLLERLLFTHINSSSRHTSTLSADLSSYFDYFTP